MSDTDKKIKEILEQYKDYLETKEAKEHLQTMEREKKEVLELMGKLSQMDKKSAEFTELVLYGLLPYSNTKAAKRVSLFPAFMNIKIFFKEYNYSDEEWVLIANRIFNLCSDFKKNPDRLSEFIEEFTKDKYNRRLQCGSITPILFCINDNFPIVNNRAIRTFRSIKLILGEKEKLSQKLEDYPENIEKINVLVGQLGLELLKNHNYQDLFFYWYDSEILSEERRIITEETEEGETETETEEEVKIEKVDIKEFIEEVNTEKGFDFTPHSLGDPQRIKINQIIALSSKARWVLPHFQRYFDWNKNDVRDFWESIFNDYYVGSFLLWDTDRNPELGIQPILGVAKGEEDIKPDSIILDGQQRITSLHYAIKAPSFALRGSKIPLYFYINFYHYFNKNSKDGAIEIHTKKISREDSFKQMLFPLYELEAYNQWVDDFEDFLLSQTENQDKVRKIRRVIDKKLRHIWEGFEIPYIALPESMELFQVTDIFENINTKGKLLSVFDLLIARLYKNEIELKKMWDATLKNYSKISRYFKTISKTPIYILQAISLLYEKSSSAKRADILDIYKNIYDKDSDRNFQEDWDDVADYMDKAIEKFENMRDGFGVKDEKELPFAPMIPVLTALLKVINEKDNKAECYKKLNKWYWSAVFTKAYSSAADTQMTQDFKEVKKWFDSDGEIPRTIIQMTRNIQNLYFRDTQSKSDAKYRGIMSLIALEGAKDFDTSQTLENARGNDKDHIFPKSFNFGFGSNKYIHSILNMTWMSDSTNREIKRCKKPSLYVSEFIKTRNNNKIQFAEILKTHFINQKAFDYLLSDKFEEFLSERENTITSKIKGIIGYNELKTEKTLISPANPFTNRIIFVNTLKSCDEYIHWVDKYFSKNGLELLAESIDEKIKEIKIIMSIEKADDNFRSLFKDFKEEISNRNIKCELRVITDPKIKSSIHDRFIITKYDAYNIPSPDIIARGQLSEISKSGNKVQLEMKFQDLWSKSKDILLEWNGIIERKNGL